MPKKIYDIIPPKAGRANSSRIKTVSESGNQRNKKAAEPLKSGKNFLLLKVFVGIVCLLAAGGIAAYYIFTKTVIDVFPQIDDFSSKTSLTIDPDATSPDLNAKVLPAKVFKDQRSFSQNFVSTGSAQKQVKATGTIRVYNSYSDASQSLVSGTRLVSTDGKLFKTTQKITIPGGTYSKGKLVPGYVDVSVEAAQAGESYNIGPSTFSIPGFAGTAKYTAFYGKSATPMAGGFIGQSLQVSASDLDNAQKTLEAKLQDQSKTALKNMVPNDYVFVDSLVVAQFSNESSSLKVQAQGDSFSYSAQINSSVLAFKKADIDAFAKQFLSSNIAAGKIAKQGTLMINYSDASASSDKEILNLTISTKIYSNIDLNEFKKAVLGKPFEELKLSLADMPQIKKVEIKSAPLFIKNVPNNINRVEAVLILDY